MGEWRGFPITFIRHNDVRRGQLIAEVVVADGSFIQQLAGIEDAQRGAQIDPGLIHRRGEDIEDLLWVAQTGGFDQQAIGFALAQQGVQPNLHRQAIDAAHAAAGDLFEQGAAAEKAGDQIGSGHSFLQDKCNVVTVTPILTKKGGKEKS